MSTLTVVDQLYVQSPDRQPVSVPVRYAREVSDSQPYMRELVAGPRWEKLETGWIKGQAIIELVNLEGKWTQTVPYPEEVEAAARKIIQLSGDGAPLLIPAQEHVRVRVGDVGEWKVRCDFEARYSLTVIQA